MFGDPSSPWIIRSEPTLRGRRYNIWDRSTAIASDIVSLEHARIIQAAPDLFEFARALCVMAQPKRADLADQRDPREIVALCRAMMPMLEQARSNMDQMGPPSSGAVPAKSHIAAGRGIEPGTTRGHDDGNALPPKTSSQPFDKQFQDALSKIYKEARTKGTSLKELSNEVGISRAQFSRWRKEPPSTIRTIAKLQMAIKARRNAPT